MRLKTYAWPALALALTGGVVGFGVSAVDLDEATIAQRVKEIGPNEEVRVDGVTFKSPTSGRWVLIASHLDTRVALLSKDSYKRDALGLISGTQVQVSVLHSNLIFENKTEFLNAMSKVNDPENSLFVRDQGINIISHSTQLAPTFGDFCVLFNEYLSEVYVDNETKIKGFIKILAVSCVLPSDRKRRFEVMISDSFRERPVKYSDEIHMGILQDIFKSLSFDK